MSGLPWGIPWPGRRSPPRQEPPTPPPAPVPPAEPEPPPYASVRRGLNLNDYHWRSPENLERVRQLGIRHIRLTAILQPWEADEHSYRAALRESADMAAEDGVRILWVLHNTTAYFRVPLDAGWWARMIGFAEWMAALPATEGIQLWNEQDQWHQAPFGAGVDLVAEDCGRHYAEFLRLAYPRIKAVRPSVQVASGGTADFPAEQRGPAFLRGMMESAPPVDAIAVHAYGPWGRVRGMLVEARQLIGDHAPLWLTETGNDRPAAFDPGYQLECWRSVLEGNGRERLAARVYPYSLVTDPADPGHGMHDVDGTPRPVWEWMRTQRPEVAR